MLLFSLFSRRYNVYNATEDSKGKGAEGQGNQHHLVYFLFIF